MNSSTLRDETNKNRVVSRMKVKGRKRDSSYLLILSFFMLIFFGLESGVFAQKASITLEQVRNGSDAEADALSPDTFEVEWQNGNLGPQQAHFAESFSVPYRAVMTDMPPGEVVTLTLEFDIKHSGKHALDYLTHYDRMEPHYITFGHEVEFLDPTEGTGLSRTVVDGKVVPDDRALIPEPATSIMVANGEDQPYTSYMNIKSFSENGVLWISGMQSSRDLIQSYIIRLIPEI